MKALKLIDTEMIETNNTFHFADGVVTVIEREVHELYAPQRASAPRLIIDGAIEGTRNFIARSRAEIGELSSLMQELTTK